MACIFSDIVVIPDASCPLQRSTLLSDMIYISVTYHWDQGNANESEDPGEGRFCLGFYQFPPAILAAKTQGNFLSVTRINISDMDEDQSVYVKSNKLLLAPLCRFCY